MKITNRQFASDTLRTVANANSILKNKKYPYTVRVKKEKRAVDNGKVTFVNVRYCLYEIEESEYKKLVEQYRCD